MELTVIGARPYEQVRELCHALKESEEKAINDEAKRLEALIPTMSVVIPIPGHEGRAKQTLTLAREIQRCAMAKKKVVLVLDALECIPHESVCEMKHRGLMPKDGDVAVRWNGFSSVEGFMNAVQGGFHIFLLDNVIDTGTNVRACHNTVGKIPVIATGDTGAWQAV